MKRTAMLGAVITTALVFSATGAAAENCRSACNQVRNVCHDTAKGVEKGLRGTCAVNDRTCVDGCTPDDKGCKRACKDTSKNCKRQARAARKTARATCKLTRDGCREVCNLTEDRACTDVCAEGAKASQKTAKQTYVDCRNACPDDDTEDACRALCESNRESDDAAWVSGFDACVAACLPTTTTTSTTLP